MNANLPYLVSPGSIKTCLERIRQAATPERVTQDFIMTKLGIKGGTGAALIPYLKKVGLVAGDGTPTELYKQFRNPAVGGAAIAEAIKVGYQKLKEVNEYFYELGDKELLALIVQVTGVEANSSTAKLTLSTLKSLKAFANFEQSAERLKSQTGLVESKPPAPPPPPPPAPPGEIGLNLSYTINLNLPATTDQAVFNAIFRSIREHLLSNAE